MKRVLIANRGEIALRIVRACHEENLEAVAVYSAADRAAPYVRAADRAVSIGPPPASESYLSIDRLLEAAAATGADAVHPGYGFLAERAVFAEAVERAGLVWVGPPPAAIRAMGDKTEARRRMQAAGVPIVPGATAPLAEPTAAGALAQEIGFPVIVKAAAGGGGKGMRVVQHGRARRRARHRAAEAQKAFGDAGGVPREVHRRPAPRGDPGARRHAAHRSSRRTRVLDPAAAPEAGRGGALGRGDPELRAAMGAAAVAAARAVGYRGAGTCEFLLDRGRRVLLPRDEYPDPGRASGHRDGLRVDLVREQLRIARGLADGGAAGCVRPRGWAIECRITSEDPANGFLPSTGRIEYLRVPAGPGVRWDAGVETGDEVTLYYDSLLAKLIVWAPDRAQAITRMARALQELVMVGVSTNQGFHRRLFADAAFRAGEIDIQFLERRADLLEPRLDHELALDLVIAAALAEHEARQAHRPVVGESGAATGAWARQARADGLRSPLEPLRRW